MAKLAQVMIKTESLVFLAFLGQSVWRCVTGNKCSMHVVERPERAVTRRGRKALIENYRSVRRRQPATNEQVMMVIANIEYCCCCCCCYGNGSNSMTLAVSISFISGNELHRLQRYTARFISILATYLLVYICLSPTRQS